MSRDARRAVVGILAIVYGLGVAFGPQLVDNDTLWNGWLAVGALIVGVAWLALMVLPWAQGRSRTS